MKKIIVATLVSNILIVAITHGQITKGNWMVGGNFNYSNSKRSGTGVTNDKGRVINILPQAGYFIINKLALGLVSRMYFQKVKYTLPNGAEISNAQSNLGIGPFIRYYFLPTTNRVNIFCNAKGFYAETFIKSVSQRFNDVDFAFDAGLVVFANSSVGIEFTIGYFNSKAIGRDAHQSDLKIGVGFQIHLERDK